MSVLAIDANIELGVWYNDIQLFIDGEYLRRLDRYHTGYSIELPPGQYTLRTVCGKYDQSWTIDVANHRTELQINRWCFLGWGGALRVNYLSPH